VGNKEIWIINQYASTPETGLGGRHFYLAQELSKQGHNVHVITSSYHHLLRDFPRFNGSFLKRVVEGINYVWLKTMEYENAHNKKRVLNWFLFALRLLFLNRHIKNRPDAIIYSSPSLVGFLSAKYLAWRLKTKLVFEVRDIWPLSLVELGGFSTKHPFILFMQWVEDFACKNSDVIMSNLKYSIDHLASRGANVNDFLWVPNGYSKAEVDHKQPLEKNVSEMIPKDKFLIGYTGTFGLANALDKLLEAANALKEYHDIAFVIVGKGKEKQAMQDYVKSHNLDNVIIVDPIPKVQIQSMLALFDVCYLGLTKDPLFKFGVSPNKLFDYLYSGKPIIYAIESGKYKPVEDADAGVSIPAGDSKAIEEAVLKLRKMSKEELNAMGERGKHFAESEHEYGQLSRKIIDGLFLE
jgi:glycosyltransferase involved in cell wall biosynthesis